MKGEGKEGGGKGERRREEGGRKREEEGGRKREEGGGRKREEEGGRRAYQEHSLSLLVCSLRWSQTHSAEFGKHPNTCRTCRHR